MRFHVACLCIGLGLGSLPTEAQTRLDLWQVMGAEAKVCDQQDGGSCVTLACGADGKLEFRVNGGNLQPGPGRIVVDGNLLGTADFGGQQGSVGVLIDPQQNAQVLRDIGVGNRMAVEVAGWSVDVSLSGSGAAIAEVTNLCTREPPLVPAAEATVWDAFDRRADESAVSAEEPLSFGVFSIHRGMDIWGGDLRSGLTDPSLRNMSQASCSQLCLATEGCGAFTHNEKDGNVCFLKTGAARMTAYAGATTGVLAALPVAHVPPPTSGPLPIVNEEIIWRAEDNDVSHAMRARSAAAPLAESCIGEREELDRLAQTIKIVLPTRQAVAGELLRSEWSGNTLTERIPAWIVLSSTASVRFDGSAAMILGPEAPNPFGMKIAKGETRALVSLWSRGAAQTGHINLRPLVAGSMPVSMRLVAWLRACNEEVVLTEQTIQLDVAPAPAELILGTIAGRADLTHGYDIPDHNRRVEFGTSRFRLTALSDGTEIITRDGTNLRLSPTGRFLLVDDSEVVDVMDGMTVADVRGPSTWAAGDSFLFGHVAPWGSTDIASTFGARELVEDQTTGPSCCDAGPDMVHLALDLENGLITLRGEHGHWIGPIQGGPYSREVAGNAYASSGGWSEPMQLTMMRGLGPVAPISLGIGHSLPLARPTGPLLKDIATLLPPYPTDEQLVVASLFRGTATEAISAFERIGLRLAVGLPSTDLVPPIDQSAYLERTSEASEARSTALTAELEKIGQTVGWRFSLLPEPEANYQSGDCFSYLKPGSENTEAETTRQAVFVAEGALALPDTIQQIALIESDTSTLMIGRMACQAGTTGGSLRGQSYFIVIDLATNAQPKDILDGVVLEASYMASDFEATFQDYTFSARRFGQLLVAHTPGTGRALVYDLAAGKVAREWSNLPSGNLLLDVLLTDDFRHIVQMNSDGGFYIHRVEDGQTVLAGRIVDDEIAVWTEGFRFDATAEAATLIDLRFPGLDGQFSLDRFDSILHSPNLVAEVLHGAPPQALPVPIPPELTGTITLDGATIVASAKLNPDRKAKQLRLYQDAVLTDTVDIEDDAIDVSLNAARLPGTRHASLLAVDAAGLASLPLTVDLGVEMPGGTRRALAVAVDSYSNSALTDLNYAAADADRFMRVVASLPETVPQFESVQFVGGRRASPIDVLAEIDKMLDGLGPSDHAVLFFAGHGLQGIDGDFYFAMAETDPADLQGTALAWSDVAARLADSAARITVLIDACHSGSAGVGGFATNDGAITGLSSVPSNITILAASKGRQQSIEARSQGGGLFSVALERVLLVERDLYDSNGNGRIEASELSEGLRRIVAGQSEGRQVPWMTKGRIVGDHALF